MNATRTIATSFALAAAGLAWWRHRQHLNSARESHFDQQFHQEALQTFENEGGLVLT